jgi:hypothetical protein
MEAEYLKCIRIIMNDFLPNPKNSYEFKALPEFQMVDVSTAHSANFESISVEDKADKIVRILY